VQIFLIQLAIKLSFKSPFHTTCAFAPPGKIQTHEIGIKMNKQRQKHP